MLKGIFADFQEFLTSRGLADEKHAPFYALLFLFREVLKIELDTIAGTVRSKRGPKLPVVLTPNEVKEIFKHVSGKDKLVRC